MSRNERNLRSVKKGLSRHTVLIRAVVYGVRKTFQLYPPVQIFGELVDVVQPYPGMWVSARRCR